MQAHQPLRVGYVSGVFRNHALTHLMNAVFELHGRARVQVYIYALNPSDQSEARAQLERCAQAGTAPWTDPVRP